MMIHVALICTWFASAIHVGGDPRFRDPSRFTVQRSVAQSPWDNPDQAPAAPKTTKKKRQARPPAAVKSARVRQKSGGPGGAAPTAPRATTTAIDRSGEPTAAPVSPPRAAPSPGEGDEEAAAPRSRSRVVARKRSPGAEEGRAEVERDGDDTDSRDTAPTASAPASLPVILPRLVSVQLGPAMTGRNFHFDTSTNPPLQSESSFPRIGFGLVLESYPLLSLTDEFYRHFGLQIAYERDGGQAAVPQVNGSTNSYPVVQTHWHLDVRYAFLFGSRIMIAPSIGYASTSFDLKRNTPVAPSACPRGFVEACIPDVAVSHLLGEVTLRVAVTPSAGVSLVGGYLRGTGVRGNITSESRATATGLHAELGGVYVVNNWMGIVATGFLWNNSYSFSDASFGYRTASETLYGAMVGLSASVN